MISIEPITRENALVFRNTRPRALQDTPAAFGSTYANLFYKAQGFSFTGRTVPCPNDPDRREYVVARRL